VLGLRKQAVRVTAPNNSTYEPVLKVALNLLPFSLSTNRQLIVRLPFGVLLINGDQMNTNGFVLRYCFLHYAYSIYFPSICTAKC